MRDTERRGFGVGILLATILLFLQACDPVQSEDAIGVTMIEGRVQVLYAPCAGEVVQSVEVDREVGPTDQRQNVLWRITSSGSSTTVFPVGETPPDFTEQIALAGPIPSSEKLLAVVRTNEFLTVDAFVPSSLTSDLVLNGHQKSLPEPSFEARAKSRCASSIDR